MENPAQLCLFIKHQKQMNKNIWSLIFTATITIALFFGFTQGSAEKQNTSNIIDKDEWTEFDAQPNEQLSFDPALLDTTFKTIHVHVASCDNKYQGIVPVPSKIGNGQDPNNNLYWGCGYGIRTYFKKALIGNS